MAEDEDIRLMEPLMPRAVVPLSALQQQKDAVTSLMVISQPPSVDLDDIDTFAYQIEPLGYTNVYLVDSGVDPTSPVSACF